MTPVVSIIVPAYNAEAYLGDALASAQAQTLADIEIIVVDDCSTDGTADLAASAATGDPRIRLLRQASNGGPARARNRAIAAARGRWLALLDADDTYAPERLERLVTLAEARGADLCSDNLLLVPEDGTPTAPMIPAAVLTGERELRLEEFIQRNVEDRRYPRLNLGFLKPLLRRDFVESARLRYDERIRFAEDFGLYVACLVAGGRWWMSASPDYRYRLRAGSLTHVQSVADLGVLRGRLAELAQLAEATGRRELEQGVRRQRLKVDRCYHYRAFTDEVKAGRPKGALRALFRDGVSAPLIAWEALRQAPIIARKALRGGYLKAASNTDPG